MNAVDQAKPMKTPETEARNPLTQRLPTGPDELRPPPRVGEPQRRGQRQAGRHAAPASPPDPAPGTHQPSTPAAGNAASPINLTPPRGSSQSCWTRLSTTPCLPGEEVGNSDETNTEPFSDKYSRRWAQSEKLGARPAAGSEAAAWCRCRAGLPLCPHVASTKRGSLVGLGASAPGGNHAW